MSKSTYVVTHSVTVVDAIFRVQFLLFFSLLLNIAIFSHDLWWLWFLLPLVLHLFSHLPSHLDPITFSLIRKQKGFKKIAIEYNKEKHNKKEKTITLDQVKINMQNKQRLTHSHRVQFLKSSTDNIFVYGLISIMRFS